MFRYILKRLLYMIPVLLGMSLIIFTIMDMTPGDPARTILGANADKEAVDELRREMGLDDPFFVRYGRYVSSALRGEFGNSWRTNVPVVSELMARVPVTLFLGVGAAILMVLFALPIGVVSAVRQYSFIDNVSMLAAIILTSVPGFVLGLVLMLQFSLRLRWLPATGADTLLHFILPWIAAATPLTASLIRTTRSNMLEVIRQDYIRTAKAKGASDMAVIVGHALKNALLPIITIIGVNFGLLMGGALITETVFAIPGIGTLLVTSVRNKDTPLVMGNVLFLCAIISFINLIVDVSYAYIDPRIKSQYVRRLD